MKIQLQRTATFLTMATLVLGAGAAAPVAAQEATGVNNDLYENQGYIRGCRATNTTVQVYDNSDLTPIANRIGTLPPGTEVTLTGVLSPGTAQIFLEGGGLSEVQPVGWITAAALGPCDTATPPPTDQVCFRANVNLNVRSRPTINASLIDFYPQGDVIFTTTDPPTESISPNTWPDYGRVWVEVDVDDGRGWVARTGRYGTNSNVTPIPCP
jgi:hypothetical protein